MSVVRRDWLFWGLFGATLVANLLPCLLVRTLPLGDYYAHIELMDIVARYNDPTTVYAAIYEYPSTWLHPNSISLMAAKCFGPALGAEAVARLLLSFYLVGFPFALLCLVRAFGRSPWLAFFGFPLLYSSVMNAGLLNYLIALPLLLCSIALSRRFADRGGWWTGLGLSAVLVILFFGHVLAYLIGIGIAVATVAVFARRWRHLARLAVVIPSLVPFGSWFDRFFLHRVASDTGQVLVSEEGLGMMFSSVRRLLHEAVVWGPRYFRDPSDDVVLAIAMGCWAVLFIGGMRRKRPPTTGVRTRLQKSWLEVLTATTLVAFFVLPAHVAEVEVVGLRVMILVWTLAACCARADFTRNHARRVGVLLAALSLAYAVVIYAEFRNWEKSEVGDLREVIAELPNGSRLGYVLWQPFEEITFMGTTWHLAKAFNALENGGITDDSFAMGPICPIQIRADAGVSRLGRDFYADPNVGSFDYVLLRTRYPPYAALRMRHLQLRHSDDRYWLFEISPESALCSPPRCRETSTEELP